VSLIRTHPFRWNIEDDSDVNVYAARTINNGTNDGFTGLGGDCWITCATHMNWLTDNKWPDAEIAPFASSVWVTAMDIMRPVPRVMDNKDHWGILLRGLVDGGKLAKKYVLPAFRRIGRKRIVNFAKHFLGEKGANITNDGIKLLQHAYNVTDEITSQLNGGGA
jgi:hypothetical protein